MISWVDYLVIAFYLLFMLALGPIYRSFNKTASDYFRGGGGMLWWMVGTSGFMMTFSAWSFTGGAAKAYETGTFFLLLFLCNFVALWFTYFFTAAKYRNMRVITGIEAVRKRFGPVSEQVFTWLPVPAYVLFGGIGLYAIAIFMSSVFGVNLQLVIIILGLTVTIMALLGGSWAIIASDFLQMLTVLSITLVMAFLTLKHADIGGLSGLIDKMPEHHFDWTKFARPSVIVVFAVTLLINQTIQMNSMMQGAAKYVFVKNGRDAKKATMISIIGFLFLSPIWMIPALAATIIHPDLASEYPTLNNPNEAAYVAMAISILPKGLLGLLVCGMFAATMSSMDSGLNRSAGIIVRNFYLPILNPKASEERQVSVGKMITGLFGLLQIGAGLVFSSLESMSLFDLVLLAAASIGLPTAIPLFLGIFIKRTPPWAGWSTLLVGFACSLALRFLDLKMFIANIWPSAGVVLTDRELGDLDIAITTGVLSVVCVGWFLLTILFAGKTSKDYKQQVDTFFKQMRTPIDMRKEHVPSYDNDRRQYHVLGSVCIIYGVFVLLLMLIPNSSLGRLAFLFCGGMISIIGIVLYAMSKRLKNVPEAVVASDAGEEAK